MASTDRQVEVEIPTGKSQLQPQSQSQSQRNLTTTKDKDMSEIHLLEMREKYDIGVSKEKFMSLHDWLVSLDLNYKTFNFIQKRKHEIGNYIYFYDLELKNNPVEKTTNKWSLKKRFVDFVELDKQLHEELVVCGKVPQPFVPVLSSFCNTKFEDSPDRFLDATANYLNALLVTPEIRQRSNLLYEFIEFSLLPTPSGTQKYKEGYLKKRSGGRFKKNKIKLYCSVVWKKWQKRWFILTEEGIIYAVDSWSTKPREMLLFDQTFDISYGRKATGTKLGISLKTPNRNLFLQASNIFDAIDWVTEINKAAKSSPYTKINRYLSFAPVRGPTNLCKWYIDAEGYWDELYNSLMSAKKEVFITDWWLTPEISLKRPDSEVEYRLDKTLGKIANAGVKVYVIVYHEVKMLMYNDSEHSKRALEMLSPNIKVLKHPSEPFFSWSHHEKLVVIDQKIGFIGGLDLCFGRMDSNNHPLNDPAMVEGKGETFPGQDYANPRLVDFRNVRSYDTCLIDKNTTPRMPFHDAMVKLIGPVVADLSRHFIQYWNHVQVDVYHKGEEPPLPGTIEGAEVDEEAEKKKHARQKFQGAFRKIFGMRTMAGAGAGGGTGRNQLGGEKIPSDTTSKPNKFLEAVRSVKTHSTLPPVRDKDQKKDAGYHQLGTTGTTDNVDDVKVTVHQNKNPPPDKKAGPQQQNLDNSIDKKLKEDDNLPPAEEGDVLLTGKTSLDKEPRFFDKIKEGIKQEAEDRQTSKPKSRNLPALVQEQSQEEDKTNQMDESIPKMTPLERRLSKRQAKTMVHLGTIKPPPNPEEEKQFKEKYANLLKKAKEKELEYDRDVQLSRSKNKQQTVMHNPSDLRSKFRDFTKKKTLLEKSSTKKSLGDSFYENNMLQLLFSPEAKGPTGTCSCQLVRSAAKWSLGLNPADGGIENSIQNAYIEIIGNSKSFLYIENQFFMSGTAGKAVKNEVAQAILFRIEKAHYRKEKFRVVVFLPLVPAFEGEIIDSKAALLRIQMHWQYMTICRGGESLYEQLRNKGIRPEDYIQFYSIRTHTRMPNGKPATEMIYIHSKILIADDDVFLIGSANINDRSLQGSRDSELAIIIEDSKKMTSYMDDVEVQVGEFACTFRRRLLAEHLGLSEEEVEDPLNDEFIERMNQIAQQNTDIYREVFGCYPDDNVKTLDDLDELVKKADINKYEELAPKIQGHLVWFPLDFLVNEQLKAPKSAMEHYIPDQTFV